MAIRLDYYIIKLIYYIIKLNLAPKLTIYKMYTNSDEKYR